MTRFCSGLAALFLGVLAAAASGCRQAEFTFVPVEGTVTKGGRPLRGVEVVFLADPDMATKGPRALGRTDESGHYRLRTDQGQDGAVPGKHLVLVLDMEAAQKQFLRTFRRQKPKEVERLSPENAKRLEEELKNSVDAPRVPPKYESISHTPLRAEVGSQPLVFDIVIP